jgi:hypothetical protein
MQWLSKVLPVGQANINHFETAIHTADTRFMQEPKHELLRSKHANVASTPKYVHRLLICHLPTGFVSSAMQMPTCLRHLLTRGLASLSNRLPAAYGLHSVITCVHSLAISPPSNVTACNSSTANRRLNPLHLPSSSTLLSCV